MFCADTMEKTALVIICGDRDQLICHARHRTHNSVSDQLRVRCVLSQLTILILAPLGESYCIWSYVCFADTRWPLDNNQSD
jgi:hypothetical protein